MTKEFEENLKSELSKEIKRYKMLETDERAFVAKWNNYKAISSEKIISLMRDLKISQYEGLRLEQRSDNRPMTVEELKTLFNDESMIDNLVVEIDIEKTLENLSIKKGYSDAIVRQFKQVLLDGFTYKYITLEITK
jgi:hypothetical protein